MVEQMKEVVQLKEHLAKNKIIVSAETIRKAIILPEEFDNKTWGE